MDGIAREGETDTFPSHDSCLTSEIDPSRRAGVLLKAQTDTRPT